MVHLRGPCSGVGEIKLLRKGAYFVSSIFRNRSSASQRSEKTAWNSAVEEVVQLFQLAMLKMLNAVKRAFVEA